jgi:hypothetical protein
MSTINRLFLSYQHQTPEHVRAVRRLGELLKQAGIPVELDQFHLEDHRGGPDEGWPKWSEDRANRCACVLVIASRGWFQACEGTSPANRGYGAATEAALIRQYLYDVKGDNSRVRLGFVESLPEGCPVPQRLRPWRQFNPFQSDAELDDLIAWVSECLGLAEVESPTVRWPKPIDDFQPDLANRDNAEWPAIVNLLAGRSRERILLLQAGSGYGKSELLHQAALYARRLDVPVARLDFKACYDDVAALLGQIDADIGQHLPNFSSQGGDKPHLLLKDLRAFRRPALLILDSYEKAVSCTDWVCRCLLPEVELSMGLAVIVAGHRCPEPHDPRWRTLARHLTLGPIEEPAHWERWLARRYPDFADKDVDVRTLVMASGGVPKTFSDLCRTIAESPGRSV